MTNHEALRKAAEAEAPDKREWCTDCDDDCFDVCDKLACYLHDPAKGLCPFLSSEEPK